MEKKKFETIIFIVLLAVGINYAVYSYYVVPQQSEIKTAEESYNKLNNQIRLASGNQKGLEELKSGVAEKKKQADSTNIIFQGTDNQVLIREFYKACKDYGVKGDTLAFSSQAVVDANASNNSGSQGSENTGRSDIFAGVQPHMITLMFSGEKGKVENLIEHVREISSRKLIIVNVQIESMEANGVSINNSAETSKQKVSAKVTLTEFIYNEALTNSAK